MLHEHCQARISCTLPCFTKVLVSIRFLGVLRIRWWLRILFLIKHDRVIDQNVKFVKTPTLLKDAWTTFDWNKTKHRYSSRLKAHEKCYNSLLLLYQFYVWLSELWRSICIFVEKLCFFPIFLVKLDRKNDGQQMIEVILRAELPHVWKATQNATFSCFYFLLSALVYGSNAVLFYFSRKLKKNRLFSTKWPIKAETNVYEFFQSKHFVDL